MMRLSSPGSSRFVQTQDFNVTYGGGEANVAVSLANYGMESFFVTKLPKHEIGQSAINHLRRYGVNTDYIVRGGDKIGIYFLESGASQRPSKVLYDRAHSSIAEIKIGEIDWEMVFENANWFHWTGITPAISKDAREVLTDACIAANKMGVMVSWDLNFRAKMWSEKEAQAAMIPLMDYVNVCISNEDDAEKSLGLKAGKTNVEKGQIDQEGYFLLAQTLKQKYNFASVVITLRESCSASKNGWSALLLDNQDCSSPYRSKKYDIEIVDRVGGGDSFVGGLIYGMLSKSNSREALEFAVTASCLKHSIPEDFNLVSIDEVEKLVKSGGSGRVER